MKRSPSALPLRHSEADGRVKRRIVFALLGLFVVVIALSGYVAVSAALDIVAAKRALTGGSLGLERSRVEDARDHLTQATKTLESLPARAVGWLPVVRQNFDALRAVAKGSLPVVGAAGALREAMDEVEVAGIMNDGVVELGLVETIEAPLRVQASALSDLSLIHI